MNKKTIIGIDAGASIIKAVLFDLSGRELISHKIPIKIPYKEMKPENIVIMDYQGNRIEGIDVPSSETKVHCAILNTRKDIDVVIHTHSRFATAVSALNLSIPVITESMSQVTGRS